LKRDLPTSGGGIQIEISFAKRGKGSLRGFLHKVEENFEEDLPSKVREDIEEGLPGKAKMKFR